MKEVCMRRIVFGLMAMLIFIGTVWAQTDSSMIMVRKSDLPTNLVEKIETEQKLQSIGKFAGLGKEIGVAVREGLGALTEETNKLADTKVGHFIMFIIAFKVLGYPIIQMLIGIPILLFGTIIFTIYFRNSCLRRRVLVKVSGEGKEKVKEYSFVDPVEFYFAPVSVVIYGVFIGICMAIIFVH
jgi:hypothetical protein